MATKYTHPKPNSENCLFLSAYIPSKSYPVQDIQIAEGLIDVSKILGLDESSFDVICCHIKSATKEDVIKHLDGESKDGIEHVYLMLCDTGSGSAPKVVHAMSPKYKL